MVNSRALAMFQVRKKWYEDRLDTFVGYPRNNKMVRHLMEGAELCDIAIQAILRGCILDGEEIIPMDGSDFPDASLSLAEMVNFGG